MKIFDTIFIFFVGDPNIGCLVFYRSMWERYCRGVNAIVYMVDAADHEKIEASKNELHNLLEKPQLAGIPILVLGNKRDLEGALDENGLIERLNLRAVQDREICCYSVSCKEKDNIDITLQWLISHSKSGGTAAAATSPPPPSGIHTSSSATSRLADNAAAAANGGSQ